MSQRLPSSAGRTVVIAQIETRRQWKASGRFLRVEDLDVLFIGRAGLTVAYGAEGLGDDRATAAIETVCTAGNRAGKPVKKCSFPARFTRSLWRSRRGTLFLLGSEPQLLVSGAVSPLREIK